MTLPITAIYVGIHGLLVLFLSIAVVRQRRKTKTPIGDGGSEDLVKTVRAHGNHVEHVPLALLMIGVLESMKAAAILLHTLGILLTIARVLHAVGLASSLNSSPGRFLGTVGTWVMYLVSECLCLYYGSSYLLQ